MLACPRCRARYPEGTTACPDDGGTLLPLEAFIAAEAPLEPGTMVGEYRVDRKLGSGAFGDVYAGEQPLIGKRVAIKVLHRKLSSEPEVVSRFIAEARAVNRIRHRNIIDIFSFGVLDGSRHYFVMELLDGLSLRDLLSREGRLSVPRALLILDGIAAAIDAAHEAGVTHRDLKPDNVFLAVEKDRSYFPKLLDFGVAKLVTEEMAHKTATGVAIGTPHYMSPEQSRGKKVDHRADIYALGVMIHEMLTGRPPFQGDSLLDVLLQHATEPPPRMSAVCADLPPELDEPVLAMLAKRPSARPNSAAEALAALRARAGVKARSAAPTESTEAARRPSDEGRRVSGEAPTLPASTDNPSGPVVDEVRARVEGEAIGAGPDREAPAVTLPSGAPAIATTDAASPRHNDESSGRTVVARVSAGGTLLSRDATLMENESARIVDSGASRPARVLDTPAAASANIPSSQGSAASPRPNRRGVMIALAIGAGVVLGAIALVRSRSDVEPQAAAPLNAAPETAASPALPGAPAPPSDVTIHLAISPAGADVLLENRRVGSASEPLVLPRSSVSRSVRVEKEGYEPLTLSVVPDRDQDLPPMTLNPAGIRASPSSEHSLQAERPTSPVKQTKKPQHHRDLERPP